MGRTHRRLLLKDLCRNFVEHHPLVSRRGSWKWRFCYHLRMRHPILRICNVVPGYTTFSRLQLVTSLSNQIIIALSSTVLWYGTSHCVVEQQLIASLVSAALSVIGCGVGNVAFSSIPNLKWEARELDRAEKGPTKTGCMKRRRKKEDRRKTVLPEWSPSALTSRVSSGLQAVRNMMGDSIDIDKLRFTLRWSSAEVDDARSTWRWSRRSSSSSSSSFRTSSRLKSGFSSIISPPRNSIALGHNSNEGETAVAARIVPILRSRRNSDEERIEQAALSRVPSSKAMSPSTATELRNARSTRNPALLRARTANISKKMIFAKISSRWVTCSGVPVDVDTTSASTLPPSSLAAEDIKPPLTSSRIQHSIQRGKSLIDEESGSVCNPIDSGVVCAEGPLSSLASLCLSPSSVASKTPKEELQSFHGAPEAAEKSVLDRQRHWIEKRVRWIEDAGGKPATPLAGAAETASRSNAVRAGGDSSRLCELWVPLDRLHQSQGGLVLVLAVRSDSLARSQPRRRYRQTIHGFEAIQASQTDVPADAAEGSDSHRLPTGAVLPVRSLGVAVLSGLPKFMIRPCVQDVALVRISTTDLPSRLLTDDLTVSKLKGGGLKISLSQCSPMVLIAWMFNLTILAGGAFFLLFVYLVIFEEADDGWAPAVLLSTLLSLGLSLAVYDVLASALIAAIPVRSSRSRSPLEHCIEELVGQCCG